MANTTYLPAAPLSALSTLTGPTQVCAGIYDASWSVANIGSTDELFTAIQVPASASNVKAYSKIAYAANFSAGLPTNAFVDGFQVRYERSNFFGVNAVRDGVVTIVNLQNAPSDPLIVGVPTTVANNNWTQVTAFSTAGSSTELFGCTAQATANWVSDFINTERFGVGIAVLNQTTSSQAGQAANLQVRIYYHLLYSFIVTPDELGYESSPVIFSKNFVPLNSEVGFEITNPAIIQQHNVGVQSAEFGFETNLTPITYSVIPQSSEYGYECGSVSAALVVRDVNVFGAEFGYEVNQYLVELSTESSAFAVTATPASGAGTYWVNPSQVTASDDNYSWLYMPDAVTFASGAGNSGSVGRWTTIGTSAPLSPIGTMSFWIRRTETAAHQMEVFDLVSAAVARGSVFINNNRQLDIQWINAAGTNVFDIQTPTSSIGTTNWVHVLAAWDTRDYTKNQIYLNDVQQTITVVVSAASAAVAWKGTSIFFGQDRLGRNQLLANMSEFYLNPDTWLDLTNTSVRRSFITSSLEPAYLGTGGELPTGTRPLIYLKGNKSRWMSSANSNAGYGASWNNPLAIADSTFVPTVTAKSALNFLQFNFNIPTTALVSGVEFFVERHVSGGGAAFINDNSLRVLVSGAAVGNSRAVSAVWATATNTFFGYGSAQDDWGVPSLTPSKINSDQFGIQLIVDTSGDAIAKVDSAYAVIHYTVVVSAVKAIEDRVQLTPIYNVGFFFPEFGFEIQSGALSQVHNVGVQSSEYGYELYSPNISVFYITPPEFGFEIQSVALTQVDIVGVQSAEFGFEIATNQISYNLIVNPDQFAQFRWQSGFEISNVSLTQTQNVGVQSAEFGEEITSVAVAKFVPVNPISSEYGYGVNRRFPYPAPAPTSYIYPDQYSTSAGVFGTWQWSTPANVTGATDGSSADCSGAVPVVGGSFGWDLVAKWSNLDTTFLANTLVCAVEIQPKIGHRITSIEHTTAAVLFEWQFNTFNVSGIITSTTAAGTAYSLTQASANGLLSTVTLGPFAINQPSTTLSYFAVDIKPNWLPGAAVSAQVCSRVDSVGVRFYYAHDDYDPGYIPLIKIDHVIDTNSDEFGYECKSVALTQVHNVRPLSCEFGYECDKIPVQQEPVQAAPTDFGFEISDVGLIQLYTVQPNSCEFGCEILSVDETAGVLVPGGEYGFEIESVGLRQFSFLTVPPARIKIVRQY